MVLEDWEIAELKLIAAAARYAREHPKCRTCTGELLSDEGWAPNFGQCDRCRDSR